MRGFRVREAGPLATVQDRGRVGLAHLGVPAAGALDDRAAQRANLLVGNTLDDAVVEVTVGPFDIEVTAAMTVAVTGGVCDVRVNGLPAAWGDALSLASGDRLQLGVVTRGVRAYVAFAGGVDVEPVLGSRSTDTLAWIGPPRIEAGSVIAVAPHHGEPQLGGPALPPADEVRLRYVVGPRDDWFESLPTGDYRVGAESNRIGLRLEGAPLRRIRDDELPSEGIVLGAIQVPTSGQPLVFLRDHPTTGGYPVVGVVLREDLHLCAQLPPGAVVRLQPL